MFVVKAVSIDSYSLLFTPENEMLNLKTIKQSFFFQLIVLFCFFLIFLERKQAKVSVLGKIKPYKKTYYVREVEI